MVERREGRGFFGIKGRFFDVLSRLALREDVVAPLPAVHAGDPPVGECERLARFLASELRLPLAALARLGARCATASEPDLAAVGRALARESERLDVLVTNTLELGLMGEESLSRPVPNGRVDVEEVLEKVVAGQRALIEGFAIRVRVADCARAPIVLGDRRELMECFSALLSDLLERVPRRGQVDLRLRELHGFVRLDARAREAAPPAAPDRTTMLRAQELVHCSGGELWELEDGERGFGLTLPRHGRVAAAGRRESPQGAVNAAPMLTIGSAGGRAGQARKEP